MKKFLILVLCALLIMCSAVAEENGEAWRVRICSIEIEIANSVVMPTQEVEIVAGRQNGEWWMRAVIQRSVDLKMQPCLTFQTTLAGDVLTGSVEGANDALQTDDAAAFFGEYNVSLEDVENWLNGIFTMMENRVDPQIENFEVDFYKNGKNGGYFTVNLPEMEVRFQLLWEAYDGEIPFDLGAESKNVHVLDASALGEGTDLPDAFNVGLEELKKSSSFCYALDFILNNEQ